MSAPVKRTTPKPVIIHLQGQHEEKGRCGRRGRRTTNRTLVTCSECQPVHRAMPSTALAALVGGSR